LPHVLSSLPENAVPSGFEPVRMSCLFIPSSLVGTISPFSVSAVCLFRLLVACSSVTSFAMTTPLAFCHGPFPMRSRALTACAPCVLRYAFHVQLPAPAAAARVWQCLSAPSRPPKSAPLPDPTLVTKKLIFADCDCASTLRLTATQ